MATGALTIENLLATQHQSVAEFGLDTVQEVLDADIAAHNQLVTEMVSELCEVTTDRQRIYGASQDTSMVEVDELGDAPTSQPKAGSSGGFPLRKFQRPIGWTSTWFKTHTPADMARAVQGVQKAHLQQIQTQIKYAIFRAGNYTYNDHLVDKVDLTVKRFVNADSQVIPDGPNGETFNGATHTHYDANNGWSESVLLASINDVVEHGHGEMVKLYINRANESTVRGYTTNFNAYIDPRLMAGISSNTPESRLDISRIDNRAIGLFGAAEVWVKPWVPANYTFVADVGAQGKPLAFRQREQDVLQGLMIAAELDTHPLYAQYMEAEFGVGVWTRTNGACTYFGGASWTDAF